MDKNILKKIGIGILVLFIVFLLYKIFQLEEKESYFKKIELNNKNGITNRTDIPYLDTIVSVGLDELAIKDIKVVILPLKNYQIKNLNSGLEIRAHVRGVGNYYYIWIDNMMTKDDFVGVLSHEIVHIHQYYSGRLMFDDNKIKWMGKEYSLDELSYENRPWENEAFFLESEIKTRIVNKLYQ